MQLNTQVSIADRIRARLGNVLPSMNLLLRTVAVRCKCYKITEKTGNLVGVKAVNDDNEIMIINTEGIIIRMKVSDISILGRVTSGVKLINMENDVTVASITKVKEDETLEGEEAAEDAEETDAETATEAAADEQK